MNYIITPLVYLIRCCFFFRYFKNKNFPGHFNFGFVTDRDLKFQPHILGFYICCSLLIKPPGRRYSKYWIVVLKNYRKAPAPILKSERSRFVFGNHLNSIIFTRFQHHIIGNGEVKVCICQAFLNK